MPFFVTYVIFVIRHLALGEKSCYVAEDSKVPLVYDESTPDVDLAESTNVTFWLYINIYVLAIGYLLTMINIPCGQKLFG